MANEQRDYAGGAVETTIVSGINATDLGITIASSTGWPTGGANGPFFVVVDKGLAGEEKIEIQSRTGTSLTVASTGKRGVDGTTASTHAAGATIAHCLTAQDIQEANSHIANTALDHHTQYLNVVRHAAISHTQAMLGADSVGSTQIQANAVTASELANDAVDTAAILASNVTTAKIADSNVTTPKIADLNVTTGKIADLNVTTAKIADLGVTTGKLADDAVNAAKLADNAVDTAAILDAAITVAKIGFGAPSTYVPTFGGVVTATNVTGHYYKIGRLIVGWAGCSIGAGGVTSTITVSLPFANGGGFDGVIAARGRATGGNSGSGMGIIVNTESTGKNIVSIGSDEWQQNIPFGWTLNSTIRTVFLYVSA